VNDNEDVITNRHQNDANAIIIYDKYNIHMFKKNTINKENNDNHFNGFASIILKQKNNRNTNNNNIKEEQLFHNRKNTSNHS